MGRFSGPLVAEKLNSDLWRVKAPFTYFYVKDGVERSVTVPAEYVTDLASVPLFVRGLIPKDGTYTQAAVVHDYLCEYSMGTWKDRADIFISAMRDLGVPATQRNLMYWGVRLYGWMPGGGK